MTKEFDLSFQFKGERDYVHGTDIYNTAIAALEKQELPKPETFELAFHKVIRHNLRAELKEGKSVSDTDGLAALARFQSGDTHYVLALRENKSSVEGRYVYPEDEICEAGQMDLAGKSITLENFSEHTNIEKIVALNKHLLSRLFKEEKGKWYFGKLQLTSDIKGLSVNRFVISLERNIGVKFTKSSIVLDGKPVGYIFFSMKF